MSDQRWFHSLRSEYTAVCRLVELCAQDPDCGHWCYDLECPVCRIVLVRYLRSEGRLSQISVEDCGSALGWELPLDAICVNGSFAQLLTVVSVGLNIGAVII
jgi:hypothetical protein